MMLSTSGKYIYRLTTLDKEYSRNNGFNNRVYEIAYLDINKIAYPHPVTKFLINYRSKSMSLERERQVASTVCQFLNYTLKMAHLGEEDFTELCEQGLFGLSFVHGSKFLQDQEVQLNKNGQYVNKETVDRKEYVLVDLYVFLRKQGVIDKNLIISTYKNEKGQEKHSTPFVRKNRNARGGTPKKDLRDFGENRQQLLVEFIDTALSLKSCKHIAFGLALEGFGGLRRGEVVNLVTSSIKYSGNSLLVDIDDRQDHLFKHKRNLKKEQVKKCRPQIILPSEYINQLYHGHFKLLKSIQTTKNFTVKDALFVNKSGSPMTGKTYETKFKIVVSKFLERLLIQKRFDEYTFLTSKVFNTHTLRGVFTNICLDDLGLNVRQTANARGDASDNTVMVYVEELTGMQKMNKAITQLSQAVIDAEKSRAFFEDWNAEVV